MQGQQSWLSGEECLFSWQASKIGPQNPPLVVLNLHGHLQGRAQVLFGIICQIPDR